VSGFCLRDSVRGDLSARNASRQKECRKVLYKNLKNVLKCSGYLTDNYRGFPKFQFWESSLEIRSFARLKA
jgi:hypothetical protein